MSERTFALIVLTAPDNTLETLLLLMPQVLAALASTAPGHIISIVAHDAA